MTSHTTSQSNDRPTSRIHHDILDRCLKNRIGGCSACSKLADIDHRISAATDDLDPLLEEREGLAFILNAQHDPFSYRFPVEVATRVFGYLTPAASISDSVYDEKEVISAAFGPGHICSNWRWISHGTPQLWTILCSTITRHNCASSLDMLRQWLERSQCLPLFIQLFIPDGYDDLPGHAQATEIFTLIAQHASRWEALHLRSPSNFLPSRFNLLAAQDLERLDHLRIKLHDGLWGHLNLAAAAPRRLTIDGFPIFSSISIRWDSLTYISLDHCFEEQMRQIVLLAPNIVSCSVAAMKNTSFTLIHASRLMIHNSLQFLNVNDFPWGNYSFPSLKNLHLEDMYWPEDPPRFPTAIREFLLRSECDLKELTILDDSIAYFYQEELVDVLKQTPNLERLVIGARAPLFSAMDSVASSTKDPLFLPKLKSLTCKDATFTFDWSGLVGLLATMRSGRYTSLQSFVFQYQVHCKADNIMVDEEMFNYIMNVIQGLDFNILDGQGKDLLEGLRRSFR